ncbi:MAG: Txe/YoeB family addiction module toxin [Muribaculaceae bacterium]|nr:Txe/YoeB family addiction module toxin [Muribaculaceae bacterium]
MYRIVFTREAQQQYRHFIKSGNVKLVEKINRLIVDIAEHPYTGIGKPEALRFSLAGKWSRHINHEHRIVYTVNDQTVIVTILTMRYHYTK